MPTSIVHYTLDTANAKYPGGSNPAVRTQASPAKKANAFGFLEGPEKNPGHRQSSPPVLGYPTLRRPLYPISIPRFPSRPLHSLPFHDTSSSLHIHSVGIRVVRNCGNRADRGYSRRHIQAWSRYVRFQMQFPFPLLQPMSAHHRFLTGSITQGILYGTTSIYFVRLSAFQKLSIG